jgi:hypothetical protein
MKYINLLIIIIIIIICSSCRTSNHFYDTANQNIKEFDNVYNYIDNNMLLNTKDSIVLKDNNNIYIKDICLYNDNGDSLIRNFMNKYKISMICRYDDSPSLVYFIKDVAPYLSSPKIVYDNGSSYLRERINKGEKTDGDGNKIEIINNKFVFISSN